MCARRQNAYGSRVRKRFVIAMASSSSAATTPSAVHTGR